MSKLSAGLRGIKQLGVKTQTNISPLGGSGGARVNTVTGRNPNPFYKPKKSGTTTRLSPDGKVLGTSTLTTPGKLTTLGRRTAQGAVATGAGGAAGAAFYSDRKKRVAKMSLPGKKPIGYIRPLNFPDATGQRGPTGGKCKGDQKDISKSVWGVDHAEPVHKGLKENYKDYNKVANPLKAKSGKDYVKRTAKGTAVNAAGFGGAAAGGAGGYLAGKKVGGAKGGLIGGIAGAAGLGTAADSAAVRRTYPGYKRPKSQFGLTKA